MVEMKRICKCWKTFIKWAEGLKKKKKKKKKLAFLIV
jgi:hypothetical protein